MPLIKAIRGDKQNDYNAWLTDADREILAGTIFSSSWYPFDTYQRCCRAVAKIHAGDDEAVLYHWGAGSAETLLRTTYSGQIIQGQPQQSLEKHLAVTKLFIPDKLSRGNRSNHWKNTWP